MYTEKIIKNVGGMSFFQLVFMLFVLSLRMLTGWSMLMMSFAGTSPDWWCVSMVPTSFGNDSQTPSTYQNNVTSEFCPSADNNSCVFVYSKDMNTIINEWNLLCGNSQLPAVITSIQMVGVLLGASLSGQSADTFGRKPTLYLSILLAGVFNLIAAFSVSWQMFAALRFCIGMMTGSLIVVSYTYTMEFVSPYWRPMCSAVPFWTVGVCLFALSCWLCPNWSHQHIILAAVHMPFLIGWFIVPESLRWLAVKGRLDDAKKVVDQMCRYNKREKPDNTGMLLKQVAGKEKRRRESGNKYTYIDIYRGWSICWKSAIIQFIWICLSLVYYGISFGVGKLSGNLYLNIFLLSVVEIPAVVLSFFMSNKIGRRWTCFTFFAMAAIGSYGAAIATRAAPDDQKGTTINALALVAKLGIMAGWGVIEILTSEIYPTVIRNLGYGAANTVTRLGGILAPYVFGTGGSDVMIPFIIVGSAMAVSGIMSLILRETKGIPLEDSIEITVTKTGGRPLEKETK